MAKYSVGDVVKVRNDLSAFGDYHMEVVEFEENAVPSMIGLAGKEVKIIECTSIGYAIEGNIWNWVDGMFEQKSHDIKGENHI